MKQEINRELCHRIVEYLKSNGIDLDTTDLDEDLPAVLRRHGFCTTPSAEELEVIKQDLWPLALAVETVEIARMTCYDAGSRRRCI